MAWLVSTSRGIFFNQIESSLKKCPYCFSEVALEASICPNCRQRIGKVGKDGVATKRSHPVLIIFSLLIFIIVAGIGISIFVALLDNRPKISPTPSTELHYNISPEELQVAQKQLNFEECVYWFGGNVNTGEVYHQYVNLVVSSKSKRRSDLMQIIQFYRQKRFNGCEYLSIIFYPPLKRLPKTKEEYFKLSFTLRDKSFAGYVFHPKASQDTLVYY